MPRSHAKMFAVAIQVPVPPTLQVAETGGSLGLDGCSTAADSARDLSQGKQRASRHWKLSSGLLHSVLKAGITGLDSLSFILPRNFLQHMHSV